MRIQFREMLGNGVRKIETDEKPFRVHLLVFGRARLSRTEGERMSETRCGSTRSTSLSVRSSRPTDQDPIPNRNAARHRPDQWVAGAERR
jgi:hypothetical protein